MALPPGSRDLPRIAFGVLLIAALLGGSLYVLLPFLPALLWATMIVVATWPLMLKIEAMVGGRRSLATLLCTLLLLLVVFAPLIAAVLTVVEHADAFTHIHVDRASIAAAAGLGRQRAVRGGAHRRPVGRGRPRRRRGTAGPRRALRRQGRHLAGRADRHRRRAGAAPGVHGDHLRDPVRDRRNGGEGCAAVLLPVARRAG